MWTWEVVQPTVGDESLPTRRCAVQSARNCWVPLVTSLFEIQCSVKPITVPAKSQAHNAARLSRTFCVLFVLLVSKPLYQYFPEMSRKMFALVVALTYNGDIGSTCSISRAHIYIG